MEYEINLNKRDVMLKEISLDKKRIHINITNLMEMIIKRDDVYEFQKVWDYGSKCENFTHETQYYCNLAVQYNSMCIFKWITKNKWGYIQGYYDRVWMMERILSLITAYDRIDMMQHLVNMGEKIVHVSCTFKSVEMSKLVLSELKKGNFIYKLGSKNSLDELYKMYISTYLYGVSNPTVLKYLIEQGATVDDNLVKKYICYKRVDNLMYLLDNKYTTISFILNHMYNSLTWDLYENAFKLLLHLREFGYIDNVDLYLDTYQYLLNQCISNTSSISTFEYYKQLGGNFEPSRVGGLISLSQFNCNLLQYLVEQNYITCDFIFEYILQTNVCSEKLFYFILYMREFGYISPNSDLYLQVYQHVLNDILLYTNQVDIISKVYKLGAQVSKHAIERRAEYMNEENVKICLELLKHINWKYILSVLELDSRAYKNVAKFLYENGYTSRYDLIKTRVSKMKYNKYLL